MNKVSSIFMASSLLLALTLTGCTKKKDEAAQLPPADQGAATTQPEANMVMAPEGGVTGESDFTLDAGAPEAVPANPTE